jgi:hypothetical protein
MTNRVRGQLVNDQDYVLGSVFGEACLAGMSLNSCSQCVQRAGIERQVQDRDDWFTCRMVIGHAIASRRFRLRQTGYVRRSQPQAPQVSASGRAIDTNPSTCSTGR